LLSGRVTVGINLSRIGIVSGEVYTTYRESAKFYDLFGSKNDVNFYKELALQSGNKALELGVGTGRVAIALANAGVTVVGLDNSVHMLRVAREKLAEESETVRKHVVLRKGDMRNFELNQLFPFIYIPSSTFDHNVTVEEREQTLSCVHKHLEKKGTFVFDLVHTPLDKPERSWWIDRKEVDDGSMIVRSIFTRRNMTKLTCILDLFYDIYKNGQLVKRFHEYGKAAILSKERITKLLIENGFRLKNVYGDFNKSEYRKESPNIILVCGKK
jgi:cyclopropane fatty-acyl-phospholipid synthase-like methyltransferase